MHIDRERGLAHARRLHGNRLALPGDGIAEAVANRVYQPRAFEKGFGDPFGAQRVARHKLAVWIITRLGMVVRRDLSSPLCNSERTLTHAGSANTIPARQRHMGP